MKGAQKRMKKIRKSMYYILLFSIVLGACGNQDKADADLLNQINEQVERLHNEEMTDLAEDVSVENFAEVEESIEAVNDADLNEANAKTFKQIEESYHHAVEMFELEEEIQDLFVENVVVAEVQLEDLTQLSTRLAEIDPAKWTGYVPRQEEKLVEAEEQLVKRKDAHELVDQLYANRNQVNREVTREEERIAREAVALVKNNTVREELENRLEKVDQTLTHVEAEYEQAKQGVGFFEGMYLSYDNFILYIDEKQHLLAENEASDNLVYYEVTDIINNTGKG